jgi:cysteinyl-tRNA synthetase
MLSQITFYNSLTKEKEPLLPKEEGHIRMYACGVTPYDHNHLGHGMQAVFFDLIRKYLEYRGFKVTYVRNYTDVDDKIINRAQSLGCSPKALSSSLIEEGTRDMEAIGVRAATHEPKVSEHIPEIIGMIQSLTQKGHAYTTLEGDVYFRVKSKTDYGKLSRRILEEERQGTRELIQGQKEDEADFALWKKDTTEGASWDSPWGQGRPGWHIECSAMAKKYLGDSFDIHGGGLDLIFPHHENEIAQSEAANGAPYANTWLHSGLLTINKQKMSKSLGNSITIKDFLTQWPPEVLRLGYLQNHYRSQVNFSPEIFQMSLKRLAYYYETLDKAPSDISRPQDQEELAAIDQAFHKAMGDDFNTPQALAQIHRLAKYINQTKGSEQSLGLFKTLTGILGLMGNQGGDFLHTLKQKLLKDLPITEEEILVLIEKRMKAREAKDWQTSDTLRDELKGRGILLRDEGEKTVWTLNFD